MMLTNATITVYNRGYDPLTRFDTWHRTVVGSGSVEYLAPYDRRQYYEHKSKRKWFETMKRGHLSSIRKGAARFIAN